MEVRFGASVESLEERWNAVGVRLTNGEEIGCDLVVGADGLHSRVRALGFGPEERPKKPRSVIIDEAFAARYFPGRNPIGQHLDDNQTNDPNPPPLTIVGVVPHLRSDVPGEEFDRLHLPQMYFCAAQMATYENSLLVRVKSGDPAQLASAVVRAVLTGIPASAAPTSPAAPAAAVHR